MAKKAVSLTLGETNLLWLQSLAERGGARSVSEAVDRLITQARAADATGGIAPQSVVGTIDIDESDQFLEQAQEFVRGEFERSLNRPFLVRERRASRNPRGKRTRRG